MAIHNESELETYICEYLEQHDWLCLLYTSDAADE